LRYFSHLYVLSVTVLHCGSLLLKCSAIGIGFNGAENNCGTAHILGILLMNSYDTYFLATTIICHLFTLNIYAQFYALLRRVQTCQITEANRSYKKPDWQAILFQSRMHFFSLPRKKNPLAPGVRAFHKLLEIFQKVSRNFSKSC